MEKNSTLIEKIGIYVAVIVGIFSIFENIFKFTKYVFDNLFNVKIKSNMDIGDIYSVIFVLSTLVYLVALQFNLKQDRKERAKLQDDFNKLTDLVNSKEIELQELINSNFNSNERELNNIAEKIKSIDFELFQKLGIFRDTTKDSIIYDSGFSELETFNVYQIINRLCKKNQIPTNLQEIGEFGRNHNDLYNSISFKTYSNGSLYMKKYYELLHKNPTKLREYYKKATNQL